MTDWEHWFWENAANAGFCETDSSQWLNHQSDADRVTLTCRLEGQANADPTGPVPGI
jgi:hypothetical protein